MDAHESDWLIKKVEIGSSCYLFFFRLQRSTPGLDKVLTFELLYGCSVRGPLAVLKESWQTPESQDVSAVSYILDIRRITTHIRTTGRPEVLAWQKCRTERETRCKYIFWSLLYNHKFFLILVIFCFIWLVLCPQTDFSVLCRAMKQFKHTH